MEKTHNCNELKLENNEENVKLIGWSQRIRDHGGKKFIDLRDREGITQVVFDPDVTKDFQKVEEFRREDLIKVFGRVRPRPEGTINPRHNTGEIEVIVDSFEIISKSDVLPFDIDEDHFKDVNEDLRLEYRYLDLRRKEMQDLFKRRHKFLTKMRNKLDELDFIEMETPYLTKSTPEGARDMLVPARKHQGKFYALPQSPQLFKQLLMVAGFERYYQLAKCFRDEDSRKDRQLEFTQVDLEMSFVDFEEFKVMMEDVLIESFKAYDLELTHEDFEVLDYDTAMSKYGSDKPDTRIQGLELVNISDIAESCGFSVFNKVVNKGGLVKGMRVPNGQEKIPRKEIDNLIEFCQENGAQGMAWMKVLEDDKLEGSITKFFTDEELKQINQKFEGENGDLLFFIADEAGTTNDVLDALRRKVANDLGLVDTSKNKFVWVVDFPLFGWDSDNNKLEPEHSPFSMPYPEAEKFIEENIKTQEDVKNNINELLKLKADCYDLALNGVEICSGALRIYKPELQKKIFQITEMPDEKIEEMFGWFLKAYNYGAPYHRGLAFGIDRIIMILENKESIREVMSFPKNKTGYCPLTDSPTSVDNSQLDELAIQVKKKEEKKK